jgi:hypothetical protein
MKPSTIDETKFTYLRDNEYTTFNSSGGRVYYLKVKCTNDNCNNYIFRRKTDIKSHPYGFCSIHCAQQHRKRTKQYKEYIPGKEYKIDETHIKVFTGISWSYKTKYNCAYCKTQFFAETNSKYKNRFCTPKCQSLFHNELIYKAMNNQDHPNFCYLMGLTAADGCITSPREVRIQLKNEDEDVLLKIHDIFGGTIRKCKTLVSKFTAWSLFNKDFIKCLEKKGITQKKSLTLNMTNYFKTLSIENKWHFLRGCWDGDGYVVDSHRASTGIYSGSEEFIKMIQQFILEECGLNKQIYSSLNKQTGNVCYCLQYTGKKSLPILSNLYSNSKEYLALNRKEQIAHRFL